MGKLQKDEKGFSAVELVLVLVIVALIGVIGWFVYKNHNKTTNNSSVSSTSNSSASTQPKTTSAPDPYTGWQTYSSSSLGVSFKYPANWTAQVGEPQCTGAVLVSVTPSSTDISSAASAIGNTSLKKYTILVNQYGTQSSKCAADGNDLKGTKYHYLQSSDQITSGAFKGNYLTLFGSTTGDTSATLPDTGIVTDTNYTSQGAFVNAGTVTKAGKTYQIDINTDTGQYTQSPVPVQMNVTALKQTDLYKNTLLLLNSIQ